MKKKQLEQSKFDFLAILNLLDQSNWIYIVCISVHKHGDFIDKNCKIFTNSTFEAICKEKNVMAHMLSDSAAYRLLYEIDR